MKKEDKNLMDDVWIDNIKHHRETGGLSKRQGDIIIALLTLLLITMIINCFFVFDSRELNWLILNRLN